jgi:hypothetical protein
LLWASASPLLPGPMNLRVGKALPSSEKRYHKEDNFTPTYNYILVIFTIEYLNFVMLSHTFRVPILKNAWASAVPFSLPIRGLSLQDNRPIGGHLRKVG